MDRSRSFAPPSAMHELSTEPATPMIARRFVANALADWHAKVDLEAAVLLTSELVTNALRQTTDPVSVRVRLLRRHLRIEVFDLGVGVPKMGSLQDPRAESGRGLAIVNAIAAAWGIETVAEGGKTVWFELARSES